MTDALSCVALGISIVSFGAPARSELLNGFSFGIHADMAVPLQHRPAHVAH